jgi:hypothetical protein
MFSAFQVDCSYCAGRRIAQRVASATLPGGAEVPASAFAPNVLADVVAGLYVGVTMRWEEVTCPQCNGEGEYEVEFVPCKIF